MLVRLTFGEERKLALRQDDHLLVFCSERQSKHLNNLPHLALQGVASNGNHQSHRFLLTADAIFLSSDLWYPDHPQFADYRQSLQEFLDYRADLVRRTRSDAAQSEVLR